MLEKLLLTISITFFLNLLVGAGPSKTHTATSSHLVEMQRH